MTEKLDTVTISKLGSGYEMCDRDGATIASFETWEVIAKMFRRADYSEDYIASRKTKADAGDSALVDESDE